MSAATPNLADVLAAVVPGRVVPLPPHPGAEAALRDADGQLALDVVRHLLGARAAAVPARDRFPLTEGTFQAVARKLGRPAGIKRCRVMRPRLVESRVLERAGSYRQPYRTGGVSGYRVTLGGPRNAVVPAHVNWGRPVQTTRRKRGHMPDNVLTENEYRTFRRIAAQETGSSQSVLSFDSRLVQLIDGHFNREEDSFAVLKELAGVGWAILQGELKRRGGRA